MFAKLRENEDEDDLIERDLQRDFPFHFPLKSWEIYNWLRNDAGLPLTFTV